MLDLSLNLLLVFSVLAKTVAASFHPMKEIHRFQFGPYSLEAISLFGNFVSEQKVICLFLKT